MYDTILVGTDGSESADNAVATALTLAEQHGAELHPITVVNTRRYGEPALSSSELVLTELEDRGNQQLGEIHEAAEKREIAISTSCFHGDPSEEIIQYADEHDCDLIVLGYQGHTHKVTVGSTADRVIHSTERPVLLV